MTIKKQLRIAGALSLLSVCFLLVLLHFSRGYVARAKQDVKLAQSIMQRAMELNIFTYEYARHREERVYAQWMQTDVAVGVLLSEMKSQDVKASETIKAITKCYKKLEQRFEELVESYAGGVEASLEASAWQRILFERIVTEAYVMVSNARRLTSIHQSQLFAAQQRADLAVLCMSALVMLSLWSMLRILYRNVVSNLNLLQEGTSAIAEGELDYRINIESQNEFGELSGAFNQMAASLSESYLTLDQRAQELHQSVQALEWANRGLDEFAYVASHDLQEPLRKIITFGGYLTEDAGENLPEEAKKHLLVMTTASARMQQLIYDLLDFSRAGRCEMKSDNIDLEKCIDIALDNLSMAISERGAQIVRHSLPTINMEGDQALLTQVYQNLINNALKFTDKEEPRVELTAEEINGQWVFGVKDNGLGIKPEYVERIFAPFKRLHKKSEYPGTGIGLAICSKVIKRHEGHIWVESQFGEGAHFRFTLWEQWKDKNEVQEGGVTNGLQSETESYHPSC